MTKFLTVSTLNGQKYRQNQLDNAAQYARLLNINTHSMKVAIALTDQSFQRTKSMGIFNVSMGLAKGLMHCPEVTELHILGNDECGDAFKDCPPHVHLHLTDKPVPRRFARVWWDQFGLCAAVRKINPDWVILPKGVPPFFPCFGKAKMACYVHDVMWEHYAQRSATDRKGPFPWHELLYFRNLSLRAMKISDLVLTHTQFNADRILHYVPRARIARVGIGFDDTPPAATEAGSKKDVLTYASTFPHKCTPLTLERISAWLNTRADGHDIRIHVVGSMPEGMQLPDERWIHHARIPFAELRALLRDKCRMAVYFSDYESYGMPPVECLLNGVPCVASDIPPIRENIPAQYLFNNAAEADFITKAHAAYDGTAPFTCPQFPTWQEVCRRCVQAMAEMK